MNPIHLCTSSLCSSVHNMFRLSMLKIERVVKVLVILFNELIFFLYIIYIYYILYLNTPISNELY